MKFLTKTIVILSVISMMTDISSEMLYPILPMFLKSIGFSVLWIGILEGFAEAIAGFSKGYFGRMSDKIGKRVPFVRIGYTLSAISKPLIGIFAMPVLVFFLRTMDRLGKGVRTAARDAILSSETSKEFKGRVFGFHRAFDTLGAAIGPILALIYLHFYPENYVSLFLLAFTPGLIGICFTFFLHDKESDVTPSNNNKTKFLEFLSYWKKSSKSFKKTVVGLIIFTAINSSDIFLLLLVKQNGLSDSNVITLYIFYNLVYALFSAPMGWLGDKIKLKNSLILGIFLFSVVYIFIPFVSSNWVYYLLFSVYGISISAIEGNSKALVSNIANKEETATAIGFLTSFQSIATLLASSIAGFLWSAINPVVPFLLSGIVAFFCSVYFLFIRIK
jgi:MFS family permease